MNDERSPPLFTLHPSSSILSLVSPEKSLNVRIGRLLERLVRAAKNYVSLTHHQHLAVDQTKTFAFLFKNHLTLFIHDGVFRTEIIQIVHLVRYENGGDILKVAQLHR